MLLRCPKCGERLSEEGRSLRCEAGHVYDMSREGYVNLVLANQKHSKNPGDDTESLKNRREFLAKGYYEPLADLLSELAGEYVRDSFLDAGCGTGYYLKKVMDRNPGIEYYACDISKKGVSYCARDNRQAHCFVGNVFHLPFADESLGGLMSVFCPYSAAEFARIVRRGGCVIAVTPGQKHLYQLKEIVYENPYLNDEKGYDLPGFQLAERRKLEYEICLQDSRDVSTLWRMTPYFHKSYHGDSERLMQMSNVTTTVDFLVEVFVRE